MHAAMDVPGPAYWDVGASRQRVPGAPALVRPVSVAASLPAPSEQRRSGLVLDLAPALTGGF